MSLYRTIGCSYDEEKAIGVDSESCDDDNDEDYMDDSEDDDSDEDDYEYLDSLEVIGQKSNKRKCNKHWLPKSKVKVIKTGQISDIHSESIPAKTSEL